MVPMSRFTRGCITASAGPIALLLLYNMGYGDAFSRVAAFFVLMIFLALFTAFFYAMGWLVPALLIGCARKLRRGGLDGETARLALLAWGTWYALFPVGVWTGLKGTGNVVDTLFLGGAAGAVGLVRALAFREAPAGAAKRIFRLLAFAAAVACLAWIPAHEWPD